MPFPIVTIPHHASPLVRHRLGGWMPFDRRHWREWLKNTVEHVRQHHHRSKEQLNPAIQALWTLIETNTEVRMLFNMMLEQVPMAYPYNTNPAGGVEFRSWEEMLLTFDYQLTQGPVWLYNTAGQQGLIGFPFNAFLDWPMGTSAGVYAFLRRDINKCLGDMLDAYGAFLSSPASLAVINQGSSGWLNPTAQGVMVSVATAVTPPLPPPVPTTFQDIYVCNPSLPSYGFTSWDSFFTRKFLPGLRPVYKQSDSTIVNNACESAPYALKTGVKLHDKFWLKGQPYSLADMIGDLKWAQQFVGGTVYQAFLSALSYHCWNSPVNGTVQAVMNVPGTYYAANYWEGFANIGPNNEPDPDPAASNNSQGYITQVATRGVAIIDIAGGLGTVALVMVGMAEVSSCEWSIKVGDVVSKGDPIGTFHFGGSTHCLVFSPKMKLTFVPAATPPYPADEVNLAVCSQLATISKA